MFTSTTIKRTIYKNRETFLERTFRETNEVLDMIDQNEQLEKDLNEQIRFKHNREYLYTNCNRIKRRFYHYRDKNNHPRITVCILYDLKDKTASRGISLCSFLDTTCKEFGRDHAEDRAIEAYRTMMSSEPIVQQFIIKDKLVDNTTITLKVDKIIKSVEDFDEEIKEKFKSAFDVKLTAFEKRLFALTDNNFPCIDASNNITKE